MSQNNENDPAGEHESETFSKRVTKRIDYAYTLQRQVDRVLYLRATKQDFGEAVEALADACIPLHDSTFVKEWEDRPVAGRKVGEQWVLSPTPADNANAFRIVMRLLGRKNILLESRTTSWVGKNGSQEQSS